MAAIYLVGLHARVESAVSIDELRQLGQTSVGGVVAAAPACLPVAAGVAALPALAVSRADAGRLVRGQAVLLRGRDAPVLEGIVAVSTHGSLVALAEVEQGELRPRRSFNLAR